MATVIIYTKSNCPYCIAAKELLTEKGTTFDEIDVTNDPEQLAAVVEKTGQMTVPQIFIGDEFVGGYDDLAALDAAGELDGKLAE